MNPLCGDCEREGVWDGNVCVCPKCGLELATRPAATVHGTGSGEAAVIREQDGSCNRCGFVNCHCVPTPPASPTVTLDRETLRELIAVLTHILPLLDVASWRDAKSRVELLLALLRAAERQK